MGIQLLQHYCSAGDEAWACTSDRHHVGVIGGYDTTGGHGGEPFGEGDGVKTKVVQMVVVLMVQESSWW